VRPYLVAAAATLLLILTVTSAGLLLMFARHDRLISLQGRAELRHGRSVVAVIPGLGHVLDLLRQPLPLIGLVLAPATGLILVELRHLWHSYARPGYSARLKT